MPAIGSDELGVVSCDRAATSQVRIKCRADPRTWSVQLEAHLDSPLHFDADDRIVDFDRDRRPHSHIGRIVGRGGGDDAARSQNGLSGAAGRSARAGSRGGLTG